MKKIYISLLFLTIFQSSYANSDLEKIYWDCDYITETQHISLDSAAYCGSIYEKILKEKFNGSFKDFLVWWKSNKIKEHNLRK